MNPPQKLSSLPGHDRVVDYYNSTWFDYRALWLNDKTRAIHFGYWDDGVKTHERSLLRMNEVMAEFGGVKEGDKVLDAGCGVGGSSLWMAETIGAHPVGIAPVAMQIEKAQRYAVERGVADKASFELGDYRETRFADETFDIVWVAEALVHVGLADRERFVNEAYRVLKPGGSLVITEYLRFSRPYEPTDEKVLEDWYSGWAMHDLATQNEIMGWIDKAGFADGDLKDITRYVMPSLHRLFILTVAFYPMAKALHLTKLRDDTAHNNVRSSLKQWHALGRRLWFYSLIRATKP
ncbi:MAG: SAM-dependent methyltransferase [Acidimicrobiia bacterium]